MIHFEGSKTMLLSLGLAAILTVGCGDDNPTVSNNGDDNNGATNNGATNNGATNNGGTNNGAPNNGGTNNGATNNGATNNGATNNGATNNGVVITGDVGFLAPTESTVLTNGTVGFEVGINGDATDVELVLDEEATLTIFDSATDYAWDTTTFQEGNYNLKLRYKLDGATHWADDERDVVVDRTAPQVRDLGPAPGSIIAADTPIWFLVDEPLDPATVNESTVKFSYGNGQSPAYAVGLTDGGTRITIDFDRTTVPRPYTGTMTLDGTADFAGNRVDYNGMFDVPAWIAETVPGALTYPALVEVGGTEYVVGMVVGTSSDAIAVFGKNGAGAWTELARQDVGDARDFAVDASMNRIWIGVLGSMSAGQIVAKGATLWEFDPSNSTFSNRQALVVGPNTDNGDIALDMRDYGPGLTGAIAVIHDAQVRVYEGAPGSIGSNNTFPSASTTFANAREQSLELFMKSDGFPELTFATCANAIEPCVRTNVRYVSESAMGWAEIGTSVSTPLTVGISNQCDEFQNMDVAWFRETPFLLFAYDAPCNAPEISVRSLQFKNDAWDSMVPNDVMDTFPNPDDEAYRSYVAISPSSEVFGLLASSHRLVVLKYGATDVTYLPEIDHGFTTSVGPRGNPLRYPRINSTSRGISVTARFSSAAYVWRQN